MKKPGILVLCGGRFALPAIQQLAIEGYVSGIVIGKGEASVVDLLEQQCGEANIPFRSIARSSQVEESLNELIEELQPDAVFSICFPFLVPEEVLAYDPNKFINFHTGPLPGYRGPMPIFEVLRRNEPETELSIHFMEADFDEGDIIFSEKISIDPDETFGSLAFKLSLRTALAAQNMAEMIEFGSTIPRQPQNNIVSRYFEKPEKEDTFVRWNRMFGEEIVQLIRSCNPWNTGADAVLGNKLIKIVEAELLDEVHQQLPGSVIGVSENGFIHVACLDYKQLVIKIISCDLGIISAGQYARKEKFIPITT